MESAEQFDPDVMFGNPAAGVEGFEHQLDQILVKVDQIEKRVNEVEEFYDSKSKKQMSTSKGCSVVKDERETQLSSMKQLQQDALNREAAAAKRMQELIRQFGTILRQLTQHKWAWPFMEPVDVKGLGLHDYYQVIDKPMDFGTIKNQMEAKDGSGYKNVREICSDVRLIFKNAMKYNDEKNDVHVMAKTLLDKFEEKWLQLLPKVTEEEKRLEQEAAEEQKSMQVAKEVANAKMARDISHELYEVEMHLEQLREMVLSNCRNISAVEKRTIANILDKLPAEDIVKALEIVAQHDPSFQPDAVNLDLDLDALSESTLWRLKFFAKDAWEAHGKNSAAKDGNNIGNQNGNKKSIINNSNNKRKKEICNAIAKTVKKKITKPTP